jgi:hypothetical protein
MKIYDVTCPREYTDKDGNKKTYYWKVGQAFPLKDKDGFSITLETRVLPREKLVMFIRQNYKQENKDNTDIIDDSDIPF